MSQQEMPSLNYGPISQAELDAFINVVPSSTSTLTTSNWNTATTMTDPNYWQYQINVPSPPNHTGSRANLGAIPPGAVPLYKSPFEETIDLLFNQIEKMEYMQSIGYETVNSYTVRKSVGQNFITEDLDFAFLREISVKFKNLLISKPTLKMKI